MNSDYIPRHILLLFALVVVSQLAGCGTSDAKKLQRAGVAGTVTLDGAPLQNGIVRFIPTDGTKGPQTTAVVTNGSFELPDDLGPIVGTHRIEIDSTDTGGLEMDDETALERLQTSRTRKKIEVVSIPPVYNTQSRLTEDVPADGRADLKFDLASTSRKN